MNLDKEACVRIFDDLYDGLYLVDLDRVICYWNKAAEKITGFTAAEVIGCRCMDNILTHVDGSGTNLCELLCPLAHTMVDGQAREADVFLHHKDGHRVPVSVRISPLRDAEGNVVGGIELFSDISAVRSIETRVKELEEMSLLDDLTRLANRNCIQRELVMRLEERKRFGVSFGLLFMDIDHFKLVNDTYGHDVGDRVLKVVAETLVKNSRPFDLIGRWGGEEFIGIMRGVTREQLEHLGERLRLLVESSYVRLGNNRLHVSISMGATMVLESDEIDTILKRADDLLYESKNRGRNRLTIG